MRSLLSLLIFAALAVLLPLLFGQVMLASLTKLHLRPSVALGLLVSILAGSFINIPIKSTASNRRVLRHPLAQYGLADYWPQLWRIRAETTIAINVGGCVIPTALALYEIFHLAAFGAGVLAALAVGSVASVWVCHAIARPVSDVGIFMPTLLPSFVAAALALIMAPQVAAPVAFVLGIVGPLVGADLMHLKSLEAGATGTFSIGGAGTFDGIVLSGVVAAYLA